MTLKSGSALLLLLLSISIHCSAQNIAEDEGVLSKKEYARYLGVSIGPTYQVFHDQLISNMRYEKIGTTAAISNTKINDVKYTELHFQGSYLNMGRESEELVKATARQLKATMDYKHTYKLALLDENYFDVRAGALFSTLFCHRNAEHIVNTGDVYEYAISLGLTGKIAKQQTFNQRQGHIILDLNMPLISNFSRPEYLNHSTVLDPESTTIKRIFANNRFTSFGRMFRFNSRIHILYPIKNGNKMRFTYQWDYYRMKGDADVKVFSAEHTFFITFLFNY
ncbi:hypothetical protein CAP35_09600 [Chitinophagaceae bacterium IBVUCB1]|nr:hypothetical protein CAP35_09600 [Chitinophagaceae bacterium IBVUCB1]